MANEGSTNFDRAIKTAALELGVDELFKRWKAAEAENLRVRGLLQRILDDDYRDYVGQCAFCEGRLHADACIIKEIAAILAQPTIPSGAESADIGKLDTAEEKADV